MDGFAGVPSKVRVVLRSLLVARHKAFESQAKRVFGGSFQ
jgi:hypothetical protein